MSAKVRVTFGGRSDEIGPGESVTFGRSPDCTVCLDPDDAAISRRAGDITYEHGTWWLRNASGVRPLSVIDDFGFRSVLAPGRRVAVQAPVRVVVDGARAKHTLTVEVETTGDEVAESAGSAAEPLAGVPTTTGDRVLISPDDRLAMVALFAGYLEQGGKHDPHPKSYAAAAARLGWPRTTLVKRIEYLRTRLDNAGVPNMHGWMALTNLAEYAISRRLITSEDLALIRPGQGPRPGPGEATN
jgi:hypothetical protein